jgi:CheY-like chemotaxis protein
MALPLAGIRVVIAEDHPDTRDVVEQILRHQRATVTAVGDAREALAVAPEADIVVTDFKMPGEDGVWLLEQVNAHPRPVPVVVVTGFGESQVPRLRQQSFARKLLKPVDPWTLSELILEVVGGRR